MSGYVVLGHGRRFSAEAVRVDAERSRALLSYPPAPRPWISVLVADTGQELREGTDFTLDRQRCALRLLKPLPDGERLAVSYYSEAGGGR